MILVIIVANHQFRGIKFINFNNSIMHFCNLMQFFTFVLFISVFSRRRLRSTFLRDFSKLDFGNIVEYIRSIVKKRALIVHWQPVIIEASL